MSQAHIVKTGTFEGPMHLLLRLVEEKKLHISEVSLAEVTEEFLRAMGDRESSAGDLSEFLVVASTLLLIKSRSLLPSLPVTDEEEASIHDLVDRIELLRLYKERAKDIAEMWDTEPAYSPMPRPQSTVFSPHESILSGTLSKMMQDLLQAFPVPEKIRETTVRSVLKLEEVIESLSQRVSGGGSYQMRTMMDRLGAATSKEDRREIKREIVVTFLALLELVKKGVALVLQSDTFSDIELQGTEVTKMPSSAERGVGGAEVTKMPSSSERDMEPPFREESEDLV